MVKSSCAHRVDFSQAESYKLILTAHLCLLHKSGAEIINGFFTAVEIYLGLDLFLHLFERFNQFWLFVNQLHYKNVSAGLDGPCNLRRLNLFRLDCKNIIGFCKRLRLHRLPPSAK